jgi:signal transduction histidine kinase/AraC-like DNA-binding protein/ligand-binding sensor domain-containing protein
MKKFLLLIAVLSVAPLGISAQPIYYLEHFSTSNGLNSTVQNITQDKRGMMWFATWSGLQNYDGYIFKTYKTHVGDGSTMLNNRIVAVQEGLNGNIWCNTYDNRAYLFDTHNETFIDVLLKIERTMKRRNSVKNIFSLRTGFTWIVCNDGYSYRVDERRLGENGSIKYYGTFDGSLKGNSVYSVFADKQGDEWLLTDKGPTIVGKKKIDCNYPFRYFAENTANIWLVTSSGFFAYYNKARRTLIPVNIPYPVNNITEINTLRNGSVVISSDLGLIVYSLQNNSFCLISSVLDCHFEGEDHYHNIWFSDNVKGICRYSWTKKEVKRYFTDEEFLPQNERIGFAYFHEFKNGEILVLPKYGVLGSYDRVKDTMTPVVVNGTKLDMLGVYIDQQDNLWFSSKHNLSKLTMFNRNYKCENIGYETRGLFRDRLGRVWFSSNNGEVFVEDAQDRLVGYLNSDGSLTKNRTVLGPIFFSMLQQKNGDIYVATRNNGLLVMKPKSAAQMAFNMRYYVHNDKDPYSLSHDELFSVFLDSRGHLWAASYGGGLNMVVSQDAAGSLKFYNENNRLITYAKDQFQKVRYLYEAKGVVFVCTSDGLATFSPNFSDVERIKFHYNLRTPNGRDGISSCNVMKVFMDSRKDIYVLYYGGGFGRILSKNLLNDHLKFRNFAENDGLYSDLVMSMIEDRKGFLWITQEKAITKFNPKDSTFENFTNSFFLSDFAFSEAQPVVDGNDNVVQGISTGVIKYNSNRLRMRKFAPPIVITEVKSQNNILKRVRYDDGSITIEPEERSFSITFAALDYSNNKNISYAYKLNGVDDEWHYIGNNRVANFINMQHGDYELLVKSTNGDGVWCNNIMRFKIEVKATFWETPFAWLLYIVLAFLLICVVVYILFYIYQLRHQVDIEQQMTNIKLKFFTDISHELRTPLTLIGGPIEEVLANENISDNAREYLNEAKSNSDRMLKLINQVLDFRKIQSNKMKLMVEEVEIVAFMNGIVSNFHSAAKEHHQNFTFTSDVKSQIIWADKDKLEKIFYNLISNAFKYTPEGRSIKVKISRGEDTVIVAVIDEGIGISRSNMQKLFHRFESLSTMNLMKPSSGIGLSLAKEYVEMHHAHIEVNSTEGEGSEFKVMFGLGRDIFENDEKAEFIVGDSPNNTDDAAVAEEPLNDEEKQLDDEVNRDEKFKILLVEDNKELRYFLKNVLSRDYAVSEAVNGADGLAVAKSELPDIIITDIMMPVMDGMEMIKSIKDDKDICHIPIIILTAKSSIDDKIAAMQTGIDDYITKPFSAAYLKVRVKAMLSQRSLLQEHFVNKLAGETDTVTDLGTKLAKPNINSYDEDFVNSVMDFINSNIEDSALTIDKFASTLNMSRTVFYRKLKAVTGLSPIELIMKMRVKRAAQIIDSGTTNLSDVAYLSGFTDPKYFSRSFKRFMGMTPSEYKKKCTN